MAWWPSGSCTTANRDASSRRTMKQGKESSKGVAIWRARLPNVAAALILSSTARPWQAAAKFRGRGETELDEKSAPRANGGRSVRRDYDAPGRMLLPSPAVDGSTGAKSVERLPGRASTLTANAGPAKGSGCNALDSQIRPRSP